MQRKTILTAAGGLFLIAATVALLFLVHHKLYTRKVLDFTFDAAYYWPEKKSQYGKWEYEKLPSGHEYYLYIPEKFKNDRENENAKLPMFVIFHGSDEKGAAVSKYGRIFISKEFQEKISANGAAVLVPLSRIDYFTDPASMSLLIQNVVIKNKCIDKTNIIGYGFSQGAKFVVEVACRKPELFRAVISGSGFYQISIWELISVLPVSFYSAISEDDKGIFEQGFKTGRLCGKWCRNSRYVEYKTRHHFWVELDDKTGKNDETVMDWLFELVNR